VNEALHERARRARERALIRAWEYRQRHYAKGVWYRFRRVLVDAAAAWIIGDDDGDRLESGGRVPLPVGRELAPPIRLFFLSEEEVKAISDRRQVPPRLCSELLQARNLALVAHAGVETAQHTSIPQRK
jgi:hypothetical protein